AYFLLLFVVVNLVLTAARGATFNATLERDTITQGESTMLSLTFEGGSPQAVPDAPAIPNLQIAYSGPSSQFSLINGQVSSKVTHNFTVTPRQAGDYVIPAFTAEVNGQKLTTQPLKLKVLKPGAPPPEAIASGNQLAFLKLQLPKKQLYLGEVMTGELQLYVNDRVRNLEQFQPTGFPADGFAVGKLVQGQQRRAQFGSAA